MKPQAITEVKHTPTPWVLGPNGLDIRDGKHEDKIVTVDYVDHIASEQQEANAAHIVKCVNAHDGLVEALRLAYKDIIKAHETKLWKDETARTVGLIEAALKLAQEETK